jgi:hypothetical protein
MELKIHHLRTENKLRVTLMYANASEEALTVQYLISFLQVHGLNQEELMDIRNILLLGGKNERSQV